MKIMRRELMDLLACPVCKAHPLELYSFRESREIEEGVIICPKCSRWYPVLVGVPHMLPDEMRDKNQDLTFLEKWREKIPLNVLKRCEWAMHS